MSVSSKQDEGGEEFVAKRRASGEEDLRKAVHALLGKDPKPKPGEEDVFTKGAHLVDAYKKGARAVWAVEKCDPVFLKDSAPRKVLGQYHGAHQVLVHWSHGDHLYKI